MKTMLLAAAAVLALGAGAAYAGDGEGGPVPNTQFTELSGYIAQAPGQSNDAFAQGQGTGANGLANRQSGAAFQYVPNQGHGPNG